jgi:hypothetical protein
MAVALVRSSGSKIVWTQSYCFYPLVNNQFGEIPLVLVINDDN